MTGGVSMDQLTVLGLDLSLTSTGCAKTVGGPLGGDPWTFRIRSNRNGWARLDSQYTRVGEAVKETDPDLIVIEGPALHATGAYFHENAGLWWHVTRAIWKSGRPMAVITPSSLKKYATGKGNADKTAMCVAAATRFGLTTIAPDEADALWLAAAGCQHYGLPLVKLPADQVAALEVVKKGRPVIDWPASLDWDRPQLALAAQLSTRFIHNPQEDADGENHARRVYTRRQQRRARPALQGLHRPAAATGQYRGPGRGHQDHH